MPETTYDVVVIGAGHNGLVCACYLARAGYSVLVLERRPVAGGAVCTEEVWPGYKVDIGSSVHLMIHRTPIVAELGLERYGLEYLEMDPWAALPLPGGRALCFFRDLDRTCESIAQVSARDARAYRDFMQRWLPVARGVFKAFQEPPTMASFGRHVIMARSPGRSTSDTLRMILSGYGRLLRETFESVELRAALGWLAAQSGPPPTELGSGPFVGWHAVLHETGVRRARGGSGMLAVALQRALEAGGGQVRTGAPAERILVEGGQAAGVVAGGATYRARSVVAACHVLTTFGSLLAPSDVPDDLRRRLDALNAGNGFGMTVRCAADALPDYGGGWPADIHRGMQLLCPSPEFLSEAYLDYVGGRPSRQPPVLAMTFTALDETLAPPGKHLVQLWSQYFPYERRDGRVWDTAAREEAADSICETLYGYAPNMRGAIRERFIQTPLDLEQTLGLLRGNVMHLDMSLDQMFAFRPLPELAEYRTPIEGLFLTGASTHPGGGVFGASGVSCARAVGAALKKPRRH